MKRLQISLFMQKKQVAPHLGPDDLVILGARRTRPPNKVILCSYIKPLECSCPPAEDVPAPDQEAS